MKSSKGFMKIIVLLIFLITIGGVVYGISVSPKFAQNGLNIQEWLKTDNLGAQSSSVQRHTQPDKNMALSAATLKHLDIQAGSMILMDAESGGILIEKQSDRVLPAASMSKMMTELLVLEAIDNGGIQWDSEVTISAYASKISSQPGLASVYLASGQAYSVRELFEAMAIYSANGATIALAEAVSGDEQAFVKRMNEMARHFNLEHTRFVNSTGLNNKDLAQFYSTGSPNDTNMMSARDVALLAQVLLERFPELLDIVKQPTLQFQGQSFANTNWMLPEMHEYQVSFNGVDGLKTGYTEEAGYCFAGTVKRGDTRLISVVMDTPSKTARFSETGRLYAAVFQDKSADDRTVSVTGTK
ncbi:D-alanyl-D-alanine carboxypeptidase family protein [Paenibacillus sp. TSA_86.1]|uniref:D-alanyl-D-alanine carboxypeptidase family protein n=1 Tax=Paenibacillus sp. TSA_86.1 TaxID=3415649 RepID=UPI004045AE49